MESRASNLRTVCLEALELAEAVFRTVENVIPVPEWVPWENDSNWRYVKQMPMQAALQKLARTISGVHALDLLMTRGFLQEVGVLFRISDELCEDISFITLGLITGNWTEKHDMYLNHFWSEDELDTGCPVRRKAIRAFVNRALGQTDPSAGDRVGRTIHKTYSDYVHARSAPIMGMVSGPPPRFHLAGTTAEQAMWPYVEQMPSYAYRCLMSAAMVAKATFIDAISQPAYQSVRDFEVRQRAWLFPET